MQRFLALLGGNRHGDCAKFLSYRLIGEIEKEQRAVIRRMVQSFCPYEAAIFFWTKAHIGCLPRPFGAEEEWRGYEEKASRWLGRDLYTQVMLHLMLLQAGSLQS
jgi:hypothetical protein